MAITLGTAIPLGGGVTLHRGSITHTLGAAEETLTLGSGKCASVLVSNLDSGAKKEIVDFSQSGSTVTIRGLNQITAGRIEVTVERGN